MKTKIFFLFFVIFSTFAFGQDVNVRIEKDKMRKGDTGFKEAWSAVKEAETTWGEAGNMLDQANDRNVDAGKKDSWANTKESDNNREMCSAMLGQILEKYILASRNTPDYPELDYKIGVCYLESSLKSKAIEFLMKAFDANKRVATDIMYHIARAHQFRSEFDKAIEYYNNYKSTLSPTEFAKIGGIIQKKINECNNAKEFIKKKERVFIDNIGPSVNSPFPDYSPLISTDESMMIFTSRRPGGTSENKGGDGLDYEDIYVSYHENDKWKKCENIGKALNTTDHDASLGLSPDGTSLIVYKAENMGDIFLSKLKGNEWSKPKSMKGINSKYHETTASFSYSGSAIYFVSDREVDGSGIKSYGRKDIYIAEKDAEGDWGNVKNLGSNINTEYDEEAVFMHPDGKTLYFSSRGHNSMGDYDIFKSTMNEKGEWGKPENLGVPINSTDDDRFFVISGSGKHGYFATATAREGSQGFHDIYMITFLGPEKPLVQSNEDNLLASLENPVKEIVVEKAVELKTMRLTVLKGTIKDALTNLAVEATIEIVDNVKNKIVFTSTSNSTTGKFLVSLPSGRNYGIAVKADKYLFHSENFDLAEATDYKEVEKEIKLAKMDVGAKIVLRNIFFDYGKATLKPESYGEIERLQKLLVEFPTVKIEISGHTDNKGSKPTNKSLSENRAKAVVDNLIKNGIAADRLESKGFADEQPVADNKTEDGRQLNRRVEFKVLSK